MSRVEGKMSRVEGKCRGFKNVGIFLNFNLKKNKQNKTKQKTLKERKLETRTAILLIYNACAVSLRHQVY